CFGVAKCPATGDYIMIMEYKKDGDLHEYLHKNLNIRWRQKLDILYTAVKGLSKIHEAKLIHKDLHAGNIIIADNVSYISDFDTNEDITPQIITDLIKSCWCDNPDDRPTAIELVDKFFLVLGKKVIKYGLKLVLLTKSWTHTFLQ
ncbi:11720_t:CDS:2, partial [Dentiscutata heterogama]